MRFLASSTSIVGENGLLRLPSILMSRSSFEGVPASSIAAGSGFVDAITLQTIAASVLASTYSSSYGGIMIWDASTSDLNNDFALVVSEIVHAASSISDPPTPVSSTGKSHVISTGSKAPITSGFKSVTSGIKHVISTGSNKAATTGSNKPVTTGMKIAKPSTTGMKTAVPSTTGMKVVVPSTTGIAHRVSTGTLATPSTSTSGDAGASIKNCAGVVQVSTASADIISVSVWPDAMQLIVHVNADTTVLSNWLLEIVWPDSTTQVTAIYNAGTILCSSSSNLIIEPIASWANNLLPGTTLEVDIQATNLKNFDAAYIIANTQLRVFTQS